MRDTRTTRRLGLFTLLLAIASVVRAQCPVPSPPAPTVDGALDPVYLQQGMTTDYIANLSGAEARLYQVDESCIDSQHIYLVWEIELGFVDNSYGTNRNKGENYPWPGGHSFADLTESDGQRLQILNVCGEDVVDIFMDYIDGPNVPGIEYPTPSGYDVVQPDACTGTTCAETTKVLIQGNDWSKFRYQTSLSNNLNNLGFCENLNGTSGPAPTCAGSGPPGTPIGDGTTDLLVNSPPWQDENSYQPTAPYGAWEYKHIYEMRIERSVFQTASCSQGTPAQIRTDPVELHASPSKVGESPVDLFRVSSSIGNYVWLDTDRDGVQDAGERGIPNVTVALFSDSDGDGVQDPDLAVIDGYLDLTGDGAIGTADDGTAAGKQVYDGLLDLDGDGVGGETNGDDSGALKGVRVIDGRLDIDDDTDVDTDDNGLFGEDDGSALLTTVTDANGGYLFTQLGKGNYWVDVTDERGVLAQLALTTGPQSQPDPTGIIDLPLLNEYLDADFGYAPVGITRSPSAAVGDFVWSDADNDGIQDPGEAGIGGVTLNLVDYATSTVVATRTTRANGYYLFNELSPGAYYVDVTDTAGVLSGYTLTVGPQSETDPSAPFYLSANEVYLNADFGYYRAGLGSVGNKVWFDVDEDGLVDAGEPGFGNVTISLIVDADGDGSWDAGEQIVATTSTASDGTYTFAGLPLDDGDGDADYLVWVGDVHGVLGPFLHSVYLPLGSTADNVSKVPAYALAISAGSPTDTTADFGYMIFNPEGLLGDRVWYDKDGDGNQDFLEPGIEDVRVLLYNDKDMDGVIDSRTDVVKGSRTTDINGNYIFSRLNADNNGEGYMVLISQFNGFNIVAGLLDMDNDGTGGETNGDDSGSIDGVTVINGYVDLDGDGTIETNGDDLGSLSGFNVIAGRLDLDRDANAAETNGDDSRLAPLRNYFQTGDPDEAGTCSTCDAKGVSVLTTGSPVDLTVDFGYDSVGTFHIGDTVYHDINGNGTQDGAEPGLQLVTLALYEDLDGDGVIGVNEPLVFKDTTDASGKYLFDNLVAGDYIVAVTDENGILTGYRQTQGSPFEPVASAELSTLTKDFGFVRNLPASISNFVWEDLNGNGIQEAGEPGVANVTVRLYTPGANGQPGGGDDVLVSTTTTSALGVYGFTVPAGSYFVQVEPPAGWAISLRDQGSDDTTDSDPDAASGVTVATDLIMGENDPTWDGGLYRPVGIGDRVWFDADGDGAQDAGEPGLANVTVTAMDFNDNPIGTATTDANGYYLFDGRSPSTYYVDLDQSTLPGGLVLSGGTDPSSSATLASGQTDLTKDFGYTRNPTVALLSRFEGFVERGGLVVEWETASEIGTVGFYLYRLDPETGEYLELTPEPVSAVMVSGAGGVYRFLDASADPSREHRYALVEVQSRGSELSYGPFLVDARKGGAQKKLDRETLERPFEARARQLPDRQAARLMQAKVGAASRHSGGSRGGRPTKGPLSSRLKVLVAETGIQRVDLAAVAEATGMPSGALKAWLAKGRFRVESGAGPVAWRISPDGSGLEFFGEAPTGIYSRESVYWVSVGFGELMRRSRASAPIRSSGGSFRHVESYEVDRFAATVVARDPESDYWFWDFVAAGNSYYGTKSFPAEAPGAASRPADAQVTVRLFGASDTWVQGDHHVEVSINGVAVGDTAWDGIAAHEASFDFSQGLLTESANSVEIRGLLDTGAPYSYVYIDSFDLAYERRFEAVDDRLTFGSDRRQAVHVTGFSGTPIDVFDITDRARPRWIDSTPTKSAGGHGVSLYAEAGSEYLAVGPAGRLAPSWRIEGSSTLANVRGGAEYVVIAGSGLLEGARQLAQYRDASGFSTLVVDVEDIYDRFSGGLVTPHAIRAFLAHAWNEWAVPPRFVVLAGAGTFDYKDIQGLGGNPLPPLMAATPFGLFASDNRLADVQGDDGILEFSIGRIPAITDQELVGYLDKLRRYESEAGSATRQRVLLVADNADSAGDFPTDSNAVAATLPAGLEVSRVHLPDFSDRYSARQALFDHLAAGVGWMNYVGHGGIDRFAGEGLLLSTDIATLPAGHPLPVVTTLTCAVGRFALPGFESLGEELVMAPDRGAAAVWAPTGLSYNSQAMILNHALFDTAFGAAPTTLGQAVRDALEAYSQTGLYPFMLDIYNILGDPAIALD